MECVWIILKPSVLPALVCGKILSWNLWTLVPKGWAALDHKLFPKTLGRAAHQYGGSQVLPDPVQLGGSAYSLRCGSSVCTRPVPPSWSVSCPASVQGRRKWRVSAAMLHREFWPQVLRVRPLPTAPSEQGKLNERGKMLDFTTHFSIFIF